VTSNFHSHLNSIHNIQFAMDTEMDGHNLFLDIDVYRKPDGPWDIQATGSSPPPIHI
jgi:hypothetical protein